MINKIIQYLFGKSIDKEVEALSNNITKLVISYTESTVAIQEAKECFENTKKLIVEDFTELKQSTLEKTQNAIANLNGKIEDEKAEVVTSYVHAIAKIDDKEVLVNSLSNTLKTLELNQFEL